MYGKLNPRGIEYAIGRDWTLRFILGLDEESWAVSSYRELFMEGQWAPLSKTMSSYNEVPALTRKRALEESAQGRKDLRKQSLCSLAPQRQRSMRQQQLAPEIKVFTHQLPGRSLASKSRRRFGSPLLGQDSTWRRWRRR